jgi:hypothetical protein
MAKDPVSTWAMLKMYRKMNELNPRQAAKMLSIPLEAILLYEAKLRLPTAGEVKRISHISNIPEKYFYKPLPRKSFWDEVIKKYTQYAGIIKFLDENPHVRKGLVYYSNHIKELKDYKMLNELRKIVRRGKK